MWGPFKNRGVKRPKKKSQMKVLIRYRVLNGEDLAIEDSLRFLKKNILKFKFLVLKFSHYLPKKKVFTLFQF